MIINEKRELAYVVTIDEIKPIEGYDRVEYARTNGWWCIISKSDNLQVGDKCVYFEVDSKVNAEDPRFAFLDKRHYKIKTQKMCKVVSQGLLMPLKLFPELGDPEVNTPVTDILKVTYSVEEDNVRKNKPNPDAKYNSMAARHHKIFKLKPIRWLMKRKWVPILDTDYYMPDNMEDFKEYADGKSVVNSKVKREGVVLRNPKNDFSFKNVSREYLLKHNG